nr:hypothetical protein [Treponema sp.]
MLKVYGSKMCPDCIELEKAFESEKVEYEYHDITGDLRELKAFLALRDSNPKFDKAKAKGLIGIPIVQTEDGTLTFKWQDFLKKPVQTSGCSDGVCGVPQK